MMRTAPRAQSSAHAGESEGARTSDASEEREPEDVQDLQQVQEAIRQQPIRNSCKTMEIVKSENAEF